MFMIMFMYLCNVFFYVVRTTQVRVGDPCMLGHASILGPSGIILPWSGARLPHVLVCGCLSFWEGGVAGASWCPWCISSPLYPAEGVGCLGFCPCWPLLVVGCIATWLMRSGHFVWPCMRSGGVYMLGSKVAGVRGGHLVGGACALIGTRSLVTSNAGCQPGRDVL